MPLDATGEISGPQFTITSHFQPCLTLGNYRYKAFYGGRGSMKSQSIAKCLIMLAHTKKLLILCTREFQNSIADSVHRELARQIETLGLSQWFDVQRNTIHSKVTGSQFIFKGLHYSIGEIKSMTGVNICWTEEAQSISEDSLLILDPTLREPDSELWFSFNPDSELDPIYKFMLTSKPPNAYVAEVNWRDNPWFPEVLETQRSRMLNLDPDNYMWVWEGHTRKNSAATIFRNKVYVEQFDLPEETPRFYHGADWGFSQDPTCLIRMYIMPVMDDTGKHVADDLYIDKEAYGYGTDIDRIPDLFDQIDTARVWPILADNARPETISYMANQGFSIRPADKWKGSVEDGIAHLRGFRRIVVHPDCENIAMEFRLYSYKVDEKTNQVLPLVVDQYNHGIDACIAEGQLVDTARGQIPIEQVIVGDYVQTRKGMKRVYAARMSGVKPIWKLTAGNKELFATADHRIIKANGEVAYLETLRYTDEVLVLEETSEKQVQFVPTRVKCVEDTGRTARTYDLSVEGQPEFTASGVLVHNCRYALDGYIQRRGNIGTWLKLAGKTNMPIRPGNPGYHNQYLRMGAIDRRPQ